MTPKENQQQNLRRLRVPATTPDAKLIENPETRFPREQAKAVDKAQTTMNDLYREQAEYGDGSCAFMVMKESFEGGVGNEPKSLKKNTVHTDKCREYIKGLEKHQPNLPPEAQERIRGEIQKMQEALQWAKQYRNGEDSEIPKWAKPWKEQLGK